MLYTAAKSNFKYQQFANPSGMKTDRLDRQWRSARGETSNASCLLEGLQFYKGNTGLGGHYDCLQHHFMNFLEINIKVSKTLRNRHQKDRIWHKSSNLHKLSVWQYLSSTEV